jgi:DNA-binding transcriptional LysR family regulator
MQQNRLDLNLLNVFDVVYTERNLTRAADVLHITQPAVSNALSRLRTSFDDPLFVRSAEGMSPTPVARAMAGRIRRALQLVDSCVRPSATFDPHSSDQTLLLSLMDAAEALLIAPLLARMQDVAPQMTVRSFYVPRADVPTELAAGTLDIAVDVPLLDDTNLVHVPLFSGENVCAVRQDHPQTDPLTLDKYLAMGHVHVSKRRKGGGGTIDQALKKVGHRRHIVARVDSFAMAANIVSQTDFACVMSRSTAEQAGLRVMALPFEAPSTEVHMYWHKSSDADPGNRWLRSVIGDLVPDAF